MKLLVVTNDFPPRAGGIEQYTLTLLNGLNPDEVTVVTVSQDGDSDFDLSLPFEVLRLPGSRGRLWPSRTLAAYVSALARARNADLVAFTALVPLAYAGPRITSATGIPFAIWHHGAELSGLGRIPGLGATMRRVASKAAIQFAVSDWTAGEVRRLMPHGAPLRLLRVGIDLDAFSPSVDGSEVRQRHGLADSTAIVCVGRLVPRKGQDTLIRAIGQLRNRYPSARLLLVGEGPYEGKLRRMVAETGVGNEVVFAGRVADEELPAYYRAGDIYASPVRTRRIGLEAEGFGVVFLEAAASGLPVIAGRSGGSSEAVRDGESGILVDGHDLDDVVNATATMLEDPSLRTSMGQAGRDWMEEEFDAAGMARRFRAAVEEVLGVV